jgi:hypothetical protein
LAILKNNGNVGIGTTSPGAKLDVEGVGAAPVTSGTSSTAISRVRATNTNVVLDSGALSTSPWTFWQQVTDSSHLNSSYPLALNPNGGNVGIGTTSPRASLEVAGTIRQSNCTTAGTLSTNTSGDIICTSDARLKNVLGAYSGGLEAIMHIEPQRFTYRPTRSNPVEMFVHAGFIAQNVKDVIPEASAMQRSGYYSLDTTAILAAAVNAIKEQQKEIKDLVGEQRRESGSVGSRHKFSQDQEPTGCSTV